MRGERLRYRAASRRRVRPGTVSRISVLRASALAFALSCLAVPAPASDSAPRGVNPKDNLNKLELIYKGERLDGSVRTDALAFKFDRALTPLFGVNAELPVLRFSAPGARESGLGDLQLRLRYNLQLGAVTVIPGVELVAPTASEDVLGTGKWQVNPVLGAVLPLSPTTFVFGAYKHLRSVAGDDARPDIDASQPRLIAAKVSPAGWWLLGDLKYTRDHGTRLEVLDAELEVGQMLSANMGVSARVGTSWLDSARNATFGLNFRLIF
jgi:hypothetical protein